MNIEQLRKDMEAGTTREFSGTNEQLTNALMHIAERKSTGLTDATICAEAADRIDRRNDCSEGRRMNIEQLRKDTDAGTQGDWDNSTVATIWKGGHQTFMDQAPDATPYIISALQSGVCDTDARRIARVPQLERIALAAEAMADVLEAAIKEHDTGEYGYDEENPWTMREWFEMSDREALAAYRESTK